MFARLASHFHKFRRAEDGVALAYFAAMLFALLGMAALAIDVSHAYANRQRMQSAADAAAMSGAIAVAYAQNEVTDGRAASASSGWADGANSISVAINRPPTSGTFAGDNQAVEAIVQQPMSTSFSNLFGLAQMNVGARGVGRIPTTSYCMIALSTTGTKAFDIAGNTTIGTPSCGMASNSTQTGHTNGGFNVQGNSTVNAPIRSSGSISEPGNPVVYSAPPFPMENAPAVTDPYIANGQKAWLAGLSTSAPSPCNLANRCVNSATDGTIYDATNMALPIHFKQNTSLNGGTTIFQNGIFYFYGKLTVAGTATLRTQNATLVLFNQLDARGILQLSAPTSGSSSGWAIASPSNTNPNVVDISGGNTHSLVGAIYVPNGTVKIRGNISSACAQVIANTVDVGGTVALAYNGTCGGQNATSTGVVSLVE
ncbi:TadE/TadG family type IV pilus assembly protein [Methylocystis parvus]|uniref:TadE/TadG family type IV pilus assembly protein n=1 Tax=Methylocystis parvus TaxID=134 RepID=UPI003C796043